MVESICLQCKNEKGWDDKTCGKHFLFCAVGAYPSNKKRECKYSENELHPADCNCERCLYERCQERSLNEVPVP